MARKLRDPCRDVTTVLWPAEVYFGGLRLSEVNLGSPDGKSQMTEGGSTATPKKKKKFKILFSPWGEGDGN